MSGGSRLASASVLLALAFASCDDSFEPAPRVTPASESLWMLVDLQIQLDALRSYLVEHPGRSFSPERLDRLESEVLATTEYLTARKRSDDELRSARYRLDLISVEIGLVQVDVLATSLGVGGSVHSSTLQGIHWADDGLSHIHEDPTWPVVNALEADRILASAVAHRDNARRSLPFTKAMEAGVRAASVMSGARALVKLTEAGAGAIGRLIRFAREAGDEPMLMGAGFSGGVGALHVVSAGRTLVLTTEEVLALAKAGQLSPAALNVWMAASSVHHICTDKNLVSDRSGGPWTPRFEDLFKRARMTLQDPENLVRVEGHLGPHPEAYHRAVLTELQRATEGIRPYTAQYREALKRALAKLAAELQTPGSRLNQLVTGAASK